MAVGGLAIGLPAFVLLLYIASTGIVSLKTMSFFSFGRIYMLIFFAATVIPAAIFGDYVMKMWKEEGRQHPTGGRFSLREILGGIFVYASFIGSMILMLTLFDLLFSGVDLIWQSTLVAVASSTGLIVTSFLFRTKQFRKFARDYFGW